MGGSSFGPGDMDKAFGTDWLLAAARGIDIGWVALSGQIAVLSNEYMREKDAPKSR